MKLVAAKCPNCGAQIEVDKNSDSTICDYCNSKIIVEDAIEKYKVEISGTIEIENIPKLENFLKLADRYFNEHDFKEALNYYTKVIELDPDNVHALVRKGICKSEESDYETFDIESMMNGLKNAYDILKKQNDIESINSYVSECYETAKKFSVTLVNRYRKGALRDVEVFPFNEKIRKCANAYGFFNQIVENEVLKIEILKSLIQEIDNLKISKNYTTNRNGRIVIDTYTLNKSKKRVLEEEKSKYANELKILINPNQNIEQQVKNDNKEVVFMNIFKMSKKNLDIIYYILTGISLFMAMISIAIFNIISFILFLVVGILTLPQINDELMKGRKEKNARIINVIKLIMFIAAFIFLIILA